jgi:hypothetical protein
VEGFDSIGRFPFAPELKPQRSEIPTAMPSFFLDPTLSMSPLEIKRATEAQETRVRHEAKAGSQHRSTGPRTPEGKAIASQNAIKHGFGAANPVITCIEDQEEWDARLYAYTNDFQPATAAEADVVRRAALAMWKYDRLTRIETTLFEMEFGYHTVMIDGRLVAEGCGPIERMAIAFKESAGDGAFDLCRRYMTSITREHDHALRTFYFLKSKRTSDTVATTQPTENTGKPNELPRKPVPAAANGMQIVKPLTVDSKPASTSPSVEPISTNGRDARSMK